MPKQISRNATYTTKIQKSRFIGICYHVNSMDQAKKLITEAKEQYRKAEHVCWAYRVFQGNEIVAYSSDAGEPHCSAGPPILAAIEGRNLVNVLCIVVRYFGGTKLGIGGLIRAYGKTAGKTLDEAGNIEFEMTSTIVIWAPMSRYADIMHVLRKFSAEFGQSFDDTSIMFTVTIPNREKDAFLSDLRSIPEIHVG